MQELWNKYAGKPDSKGFAVPTKNIYVWGVNPDTKEVSKVKVTRLLRQGFYKILKIDFANGKSIKVDRFHQFVLFSDLSEAVQAASLKVGDEIPFLTDNTIVPSEIVSIEEYKNEGDGYVYDVELEKHHLFINTSGIITHNCCRLRSDATKMKEFFNSLGSGGVKIGSHRVCTINLPRIAYNSKDLNDFVEKLVYKMELARDILKEHRDLLQYEIDQGLLPLYTLGFMNLKTQFSTVGVIGFYEAMEILGYDMVEEKNLEIAKRVINVMNEKNDQFSEEDHVLYNLEQIPGESAAIKLAQKDNLIYGDGMKYQMYSNQFIPLVKPVPMSTRIKAQGVFDASMSGGSILHLNIAEKINSVEMLLTLMNYAVENNVVYFAPNYNMAICEDNHVNVGKMSVCQKCGKPIVRNMLRVVGFYTDVSNWKKERRGAIDYESRVFY